MSDIWEKRPRAMVRLAAGRARAKMKTQADHGSGVSACTTATLDDALLAKMQTPEVRAATRRAFNASPAELRQAAIEAARSSEG